MFLELETFPTFLEFHICTLLLYFFILYPATAGNIPETKSQMRKMKPTKIAVRALDFGISPETSYRSIIHGDMGSWLPWCVANVQFPHV